MTHIFEILDIENLHIPAIIAFEEHLHVQKTILSEMEDAICHIAYFLPLEVSFQMICISPHKNDFPRRSSVL